MKLLSLTACLVLALAGLAPAQSNVAPAQKFGWQENTGWMNWRDAHGTTQGVVIGSMFLRASAWGENVGWINFGEGTPSNGTSYTNLSGNDFGFNVGVNGAAHRTRLGRERRLDQLRALRLAPRGAAGARRPSGRAHPRLRVGRERRLAQPR